MSDSGRRRLVVDLVGEVLLQRGSVCFTVTSASMEPVIRVGDRVEVRRLIAGGPTLGEVVLYRDPVLGHVIHRVLWRWPLRGAPRSVYTKGDAIPHRDPRVDGDQVLGTVVRVMRQGGTDAEAGGLARWGRLLRSLGGMARHRLGRGSAPAGAEAKTDETPARPATTVDSFQRRP